MNQDDLVSLQNEIDILSQVDHPNVVKLYEIIEEEDGEEVFLVMELMTGGEVTHDPKAILAAIRPRSREGVLQRKGGSRDSQTNRGRT